MTPTHPHTATTTTTTTATDGTRSRIGKLLGALRDGLDFIEEDLTSDHGGSLWDTADDLPDIAATLVRALATLRDCEPDDLEPELLAS